ncbi:MAG: hypothetical protein KJO07_22070 [Deltaproteobacteria bacterium]|nr:hypothetical protein [Deltaproteobacteria bacterium]
MRASVLLLVLAAACGPSDNGSSSDASSVCSAFECSTLTQCSSLSAGQCEGLCSCYGDRWRTTAFADFARCANQCTGVGDRYANCVVEVSNTQPTFANPQYISNCDAKRSVCPAYPTEACDPVTLRLLSDASFQDLIDCLGEPCDGTASACVNQVVYCGITPP